MTEIITHENPCACRRAGQVMRIEMNTAVVMHMCTICLIEVRLERYPIIDQGWVRCPNPTRQAEHFVRLNEPAMFEGDLVAAGRGAELPKE